MRTITGHEAIRYAARHGYALHKYADPTEPERIVSLGEAILIAHEDPSLIYLIAHEEVEVPVVCHSGQPRTPALTCPRCGFALDSEPASLP